MAPFLLSSALVATLASLATLVNGHMIMITPVPFSKDTLDTSPLKNAKPGSEGSDYPCKMRSNPWQISQMNNLKVGDEQTIAFGGTATHMGGACQLAITLDQEPKVDSVFKIIQVFEGGCPLHNFTYTIPQNFPNGRATFAWTWYNLIGNREVYMNCAPITVSGGSDNHDYYNTLPNQYLINLPTSECTSIEGSILKIPVPGEFVKNEVTGAQKMADATGPSCAASAAAQTQGVSGSSGSSDGSKDSSASGTAGSITPVATQMPASETPGPILTITTLATSTITSSSEPPPPAPPTQTASMSFSNSSSSVVASPSATSPSSGNSGILPPAGALPTGTTDSPSSGGGNSKDNADAGTGANSGASGSCSNNGAVVCNGQTQFGLCNHGTVIWQPVAAGTTCQNGAIQKRHVSRNMRFQRRGSGGSMIVG